MPKRTTTLDELLATQDPFLTVSFEALHGTLLCFSDEDQMAILKALKETSIRDQSFQQANVLRAQHKKVFAKIMRRNRTKAP